MPSTLFGGLLVNVDQMQPWISWLQYCSPTRFGFEALLWAQWPDDEQNVQKVLSFDLGYWHCVLGLAIWALVYRLLTLVLMTLMAKNAFK